MFEQSACSLQCARLCAACPVRGGRRIYTSKRRNHYRTVVHSLISHVRHCFMKQHMLSGNGRMTTGMPSSDDVRK